MNSDIIQWMALGLNAIGLIAAMIYNAGKSQATSTAMTNSLLRMEARAEKSAEEIRNAMQSMVDRLYELSGRVSKLEGISDRTR